MRKKTIITLNNLTNKTEVFEKHKDDILNLAHKLVKEIVEVPVKVIINFVDECDKSWKTNIESTSAEVSYIGYDSFKINISIDSLEKDDSGLSTVSSLLHEFGHIADRMRFKRSKIEFLRDVEKNPRTYEQFLRNVGYDFWTEFSAYKFMFINFKEVEYATFLEVVKQFESFLEKRDKVIPIMDDGNNHDDELRDYCESAEIFVYSIAKYMAAQFYGKTKYYTYAEKTMNKDSFQFVDDLMYKISKRIPPMMNEKYGLRKAYAITNLGYSLIENFYRKFNMDGGKKDGIYYFAVYPDE